MKIRFVQNDRYWKKGFVMDTSTGAAKEYVKRGVAEFIQPEVEAEASQKYQKKGKGNG